MTCRSRKRGRREAADVGGEYHYGKQAVQGHANAGAHRGADPQGEVREAADQGRTREELGHRQQAKDGIVGCIR